jgi:hypothetical protein
VARLIFSQNILNDKIDPFGNINLEEQIVSHEFIDNFVDGVIKFIELLELIMLSLKDIGPYQGLIFILFVFFDIPACEVHPHEEKKLKKKLAYPQVLAYHLALEDGLD